MNKLHLLPIAVGGLLMAACASIGRPDGGPRDVEPPRYVSSNPPLGATGVTTQRINIAFDENIQLDDPSNKIAISPAQKEMPQIISNGRHISILLKDSLLPNTTYTIDLADAVKDLNEGNILDGMAIDFSTGDYVDSLRISGMVLQARNLEPAQGMLVGAYLNDADSAITTLPFDRIARTNQLGQFTLRNLKPGTYQLFALNDINRDLHWDRTEDVAFYSTPITPTATRVDANDTLKATDGTDSIVPTMKTVFAPNDLLLTWFNENYIAQYLKEYNRPERQILYVKMAAPADSLPRLTIVQQGSRRVNIPVNDVSLLTRNETNDSLQYWLTDSALIASDTLLIETRYRRVDSLENLVWHTDTLRFNFRAPKSTGKKKEQKKYAVTLQEKIDSVRAISDTIPVDTFALMQPSRFLSLSLEGSTQDLNKPLKLHSGTPIRSYEPEGIRLEMMQDTLWVPAPVQPILSGPDSLTWRDFTLEAKWKPSTKYRLVVDSIAVDDYWGLYNKPLKEEFTTRAMEDYSSISFNISGVPDGQPAIVELLNDKDGIVETRPLQGGSVKFDYLMPGTYYARLYTDTDDNGEWTNGDLLQHQQPEDVYYFPKKLQLKKNWDRSEAWNLQELTPDLQKPEDVKKNKVKRKDGDKTEQEDEDEEDDESWGTENDPDAFGRNNFSRPNTRR